MIICNPAEDCVDPDLNQEPEVWNHWHRQMCKAKGYRFEAVEWVLKK